MPSVQPGSKVLVTGANGFVAIWVAQTLLEKGYSVRGSVRSAEKGEYLTKLFASYGSKFELAIVRDITAEGAFDEAVQGVDAIEHTASPFHLAADDPDEIIVPALKGTTSILNSTLTYGTSVKRVVVTSSTTAVNDPPTEPTVFNAEDWNEGSLSNVRKLGRGSNGMDKYSASKMLAEKAAWKIYEDNKSTIGWDLTVLNPPFVHGPVLQEVKSPGELNTSMLEWYQIVVEGSKTNEQLVSQGHTWIDVRDLALGHALALEKEEAGGERILMATGPFKWQDWLDAASEVGTSIYPNLPRGNTEYDASKAIHMVQYDVTKKDKILGIKPRTIAETTRDCLEDFKRRGW